MNRRTAIRNVILGTAGVALIYSCQDKAAVTLKNIQLTGDEADLISELTETIIPKTAGFIGAKDLKTSEFVFVMVDDILTPDDQKKFTTGMKAFDELCKTKMGSPFLELSQEKRNEFVGVIEAEKPKEPGGEATFFYMVVKQCTVLNFTTSETYLAEVKNVTTLIPPKFKACVPVANA